MGINNDTDHNQLEPGMVVEADQGDLGEEDLSKPKIVEIVKDNKGQPEKIIIQKGVVFQKKIEVPVDRIRSIQPVGSQSSTGQASSSNNVSNGKVTINASEKETEELKPVGKEELTRLEEAAASENNLLSEVEESIPTTEGLRRMESRPQRAGQIPGHYRADPGTES